MTPQKTIFALKSVFSIPKNIVIKNSSMPKNVFLRQKWHVWMSFKKVQMLAQLLLNNIFNECQK